MEALLTVGVTVTLPVWARGEGGGDSWEAAPIPVLAKLDECPSISGLKKKKKKKTADQGVVLSTLVCCQ